MNRRVATLAVFILPAIYTGLLRPPVSFADTLPPSTSQASIYDSLTGKTLFSSNCFSVDGAGACAAFGPDSFVEANGSVANLQPSAFVAYNFEISGPPQVAVPIIIRGDVIANITGQAIATGKVAVGLFNNSCCDVNLLSYNYRPASPSPSGPFTLSTLAESDFINQLFLVVGCAQFVDNNGITGNCKSEIDPTIMIDPSFANASQFSLILGAGEPSSTPEPCTLTLLGSGLMALGAASRRKSALARPN